MTGPADAPTAEARLVAHASPAGFAWYAAGQSTWEGGGYGWVPYDHLKLISDHILRVVAGEIPRLIVTMPPRHGKSELISRYTPAWYLGRWPHRQIILASYEHTFASSWGRKARDVYAAVAAEVWGADRAVSPTTSRMDLWETTNGGIMVAAGVGGGLTGKGANLLIIDDPVKNAEQAASEVIQQKHWDWWISTARTRLQKNAGVILVMTRWHEWDLAGQLLHHAEHESGEPWRVLNLPALAETDDDALGRPAGTALCPDLMPLPALERTREVSGSYWWASMYQQRPMPAEGGVFRRDDFRYFHEQDDGYVLHRDTGHHKVGKPWTNVFQTMDPALSEKETADWTVLATWAATVEGDLLLLDVERLRFDQPRQAEFVKRTWEAAGRRPVEIAVERNAHGSTLVRMLAKLGLPVHPVQADTDKVTRARGAVPRYELHAVYHRAGAPWVEAYERELLNFPNGRHDDQVDAFSYAAARLPHVIPRRARTRAGAQTETGGIVTAEL